jgi:hypothetical protein
MSYLDDSDRRAKGFYLYVGDEDELSNGDGPFNLAAVLRANSGVVVAEAQEDALRGWKLLLDDRIHVLIIDGAGIHLTMEEGGWSPNGMNLAKSTAKKPVTLKAKCKELGIWEGLSKGERNTTHIKRLLMRSPEFRAQQLEIERLCA